jgi:hypothetical protein
MVLEASRKLDSASAVIPALDVDTEYVSGTGETIE